MAVNTCAALANKTIEIPDSCGKLTKNGIRSNWLAVRSILEWIKGFLTFSIPGEERVYTFVLSGETFIDIPFADEINSKTYTFPEDSLQYGFFQLTWNGQVIEGGSMTTGMNPFTYEIQWSGANYDSDYYRIEFFDETGAPLAMGTEELPCTISVRFRPKLIIGQNFCTTNGSDNANTNTPCGC